MALNQKLPVRYKKLQHPWAVSFEFEQRNPVISYYLRMKVLEEAFKLDKAQGKSQNPAENFPILEVMNYLETAKTTGNGIGNEEEAYNAFEILVGQLLGAAEKLDNEGRYDRKVVKLYFTASILIDSMSIFRSYDGRHDDKSKFVKWRSTYIASELKAGRTPEPPTVSDDQDELAELEAELSALGPGDGLGPSNTHTSLPMAGVPSVNRAQKPANPYPSLPGGPAQPQHQQPQHHQPQHHQPQHHQPVQPQHHQPQRPQMQPPVQPQVQPQMQPMQMPSGAARKLTVQEKKQVKEMVGLVNDCLQYDDTNGAIKCCNDAIQFMVTGVKPQ